MANRSYLFSSNTKPERNDKLILTGLSEWNNSIPLIYRVLLSGSDVSRCDSLIWKLEIPLAVSIKYDVALNNLRQFHQLMSNHYDSLVIQKAIEYLASPDNSGEYLILEPYELYLLESTSLTLQHDNLIKSLTKYTIAELVEQLTEEHLTRGKKTFGYFSQKAKSHFDVLDEKLSAEGFDGGVIPCVMPLLRNKKIKSALFPIPL